MTRADRAEHARLDAQAALGWPEEVRHLRALGLRDGMRIVEAGCGIGSVTALLRRDFPRSPIVAIDRLPARLDVARARDIPDIAWREADVADTGLPSDDFDFVLSRYLFQHLADPLSACVEARRLLRPDGRHCIIDVDDALWGMAEPRDAAYQEVAARLLTSRSEDRRVGRRLWGFLRATGYDDVRLDLVAWHSLAQGIAPFLAQIEPARILADAGEGVARLTDPAILEQGYQAFRDDPASFVMMVAFAASGRKPI